MCWTQYGFVFSSCTQSKAGENDEEEEKKKTSERDSCGCREFRNLGRTRDSSGSPDRDSDEIAWEICVEIQVCLKLLVISFLVEIFSQSFPYGLISTSFSSFMDLYNDSKSMLLSSTPISSTFPSSLVFDQDLTIRKMGGFILRVLRGFICFTVDSKPHIYNPTTRQLVILPAMEESVIIAEEEEDNYEIFFFMGHDPVKDQLKLLCTITTMSNDMQKIESELWVFVLEAGGSWKRVAKEFPPHLPHPFELNMNGVLYYLAWTDMHTCVLVSFDFRSEEFNMIQVPRNGR